MNNKENATDQHLEILKYLSTINRNLHESRVGRELKVVVIVITFIVLTTAFKISGNMTQKGGFFSEYIISLSWFDITLLISIWLISYYGFWYLKVSAKANEFNQNIAEKAENTLELYLMNTMSVISNLYKEAIGDGKNPSQIKNGIHPAERRWKIQSSVIFISAIICSIVITFS